MSFINPIFLFALGAAALPVLFHFVRKMRAKKVPFGSLMFLKATPKELIKKRRLRDLLLMALRVAIVALLALAFARPFIPQEQLPFLPQQADRSVVLLVDRSYSMQVGDLFERARQAVRDRLDAASSDDEFALIAFDDDAQLLTSLGDDLALHRNVASTLMPSNRPTDFYPALRLAAEVLQDARHDDRTVVLISDFQQHGWTGALDNWTLDPEVTFEPVKLDAGPVDNVFVEAFELTTKRSGADVAIRYDARLRADGAAADRQHAVTLALDGQPVEQRTLPALAAQRVSFQQVAAREGFFQGHLDLGDDDLALDNRYFFTYPVAARPSLLAVDDAPRGALSSTFFLRGAFALGESALYTFMADGPRRLSRAGLRPHDVVFVAGLPTLSGVQAEALRAYVEGGGAVIVSFDDGADPVALSGALRTLGIGRATEVVTARTAQDSEAIIGEVDLRHTIFEVFGGGGASAILQPRFRRYVRVAPDSAAVVLGRYDSGDPFLVERRLGQGKVLAYTSTFSTRWTDFPLDESFVPFLYQVIKYALRTDEVRHQFTVGEAVALRGRPGATWDVRAPGDEVFQVTLDDTGTGFFRETKVPGHYVAAQDRTVFPFSVNVDTRESVLATRDEEEAYATVAAPSKPGSPTPPSASEAALTVEDAEQKQKLWRLLILLAVALLAVETVLAHRRPKSRQR